MIPLHPLTILNFLFMASFQIGRKVLALRVILFGGLGVSLRVNLFWRETIIGNDLLYPPTLTLFSATQNATTFLLIKLNEQCFSSKEKIVVIQGLLYGLAACDTTWRFVEALFPSCLNLWVEVGSRVDLKSFFLELMNRFYCSETVLNQFQWTTSSSRKVAT